MVIKFISIAKRLLVLVLVAVAFWMASYVIKHTCVNYKARSIDDVRIQTKEMLERMSLRGDSSFSLKKKCLLTLGPGKSTKLVTIKRFLKGNNSSFFPNGMPKIFHSTWKDNNLEEGWKVADGVCKQINEGFLFCHWTDLDLIWFVASQYPDMLERFLIYPYPVQRADVGRYLLLLNIGGFYRDMNLGCNAPIDVIIDFENSRHLARVDYFSSNRIPFKVLLARGRPVGLAGDFMASVPGHPFFQYVMERLKMHPYQFGLPYVDVMLGTGPLFLGSSLKAFVYNLSVSSHFKDELRVMPDDVYYQRYLYFMSGNSWHCMDGVVLWTIFKYGMLIISLVFVFIFVSLSICLVKCFKKGHKEKY